MTGWQLQAMATADLDEVMVIENQAFAHPWTRGNFADALAAGYIASVARDGQGCCLGYFMLMLGVDEAHLLNLTVAPAQQRRGLGMALLQAVLVRGRALGACTLWLEVRHSNLAARRLYARAGFGEVAVRRAYYPNGVGAREDAVVMSCPLGGGDDALV